MTTRTKPDGGYRLIGAYELLWVYFAFKAKIVRWYDVRVWFACQEAVARRCGATSGVPPRYLEAEIRVLVGGTGEKCLRAALKRLDAAGLLHWSEKEINFAKSPRDIRCDDLSGFWVMVEDLGQVNRKVPVPRRTIRSVAGGARKVQTATMLGHLLRCCYLRRGGEYSSEGSCSAAWVARLFDLDERNVKIARKQLMSIGWLAPLKADAWHRQRYGGRCAVNPVWSQANSMRRPANSGVLQGRKSGKERSRRIAVSACKRSPLLILKENSYGSKNQKPALPAGRASGFCKMESARAGRPSLSNVVVDDLRDTARMLALFEAAAKRGFVKRTEADRLKFVGAAERAMRLGKQNPCGFFFQITRAKLWHHINQGEEERARVRLQRHFFEKLVPRDLQVDGSRFIAAKFSRDAKIVVGLKRLMAQHRFDIQPLILLRREEPDWTEERWLRAEAEVENSKLKGRRREMMGIVAEIDSAKCAQQDRLFGTAMRQDSFRC
ncbi:MAG: hypothetical protein HY287_03875 [Planctomycetes bacterium]|nr:hypothetical protein [Planctomycetota bacterium]MBI3833451.1 hypothetical protein [Planctomycetota bacterium]